MSLDKLSKAIEENTSMDNYIYIYSYCRDEIKEKAPTELKTWKIDALCLFKEKDLFHPLLRILREVECDEKEFLLEQVYKEELEKDTIDWNYLFPIMGSVSDEKIERLARKYFVESFSDREISMEWLGEKIALVMHKCFYMILLKMSFKTTSNVLIHVS